MITVRPASERGRTHIDWLDSRHTFSFGEYHDPRHMGFRGLRVINDDRVAPGGGFATHAHRDMEIVTYVLEGGLQHRDSLGTGSIIRPGDVQRMTAGTGIRHSEFNASEDEPVHFLQIWILPQARDLDPGYEQKAFSTDERQDRWRLVAAEDGRDGAITLHAPAAMWATLLGPGACVHHRLAAGRHGWLHLARGEATLNDVRLAEGDGAAVDAGAALVLRAVGPSEALLFELA